MHFWSQLNKEKEGNYISIDGLEIRDDQDWYLECVTISDGDIVIEVNLDLHIFVSNANLPSAVPLLCEKYGIDKCNEIEDFMDKYDEKYTTSSQHPMYNEIKSRLLVKK